jgi:hypothetical protein
MRTKVLPVVSAIALGGSLVLAGCGSAGSTNGAPSVATAPHTRTAIETVALASANAVHIKSMSLSLSGQVGATALRESGVITATPPVRGQLSITVPHLGALQVRLVGSTFYMQIPGMAAQTGKSWVSLSLADASKVGGLDLSHVFDQAAQSGPAQALTLLSRAGTVRNLGPETIRGVKTTHYSGTVNLAKIIAELAPALSAQLRPMASQLGVTTLQIDLWLRADLLPVRVVEAYPSKLGAVRVQLDVLGYNVPVTVTAPPASDTVDFAQFSGA